MMPASSVEATPVRHGRHRDLRPTPMRPSHTAGRGDEPHHVERTRRTSRTGRVGGDAPPVFTHLHPEYQAPTTSTVLYLPLRLSVAADAPIIEAPLARSD